MGVDYYPCTGGCEGVVCDAGEYEHCEVCEGILCESCSNWAKIRRTNGKFIYVCATCQNDSFTGTDYKEVAELLITQSSKWSTLKEVREHLRSAGVLERPKKWKQDDSDDSDDDKDNDDDEDNDDENGDEDDDEKNNSNDNTVHEKTTEKSNRDDKKKECSKPTKRKLSQLLCDSPDAQSDEQPLDQNKIDAPNKKVKTSPCSPPYSPRESL